MTQLLTETVTYDSNVNVHPPVEPTGEQVEYYVENVKPRHAWEEHLGRMATAHGNIVIGEE